MYSNSRQSLLNNAHGAGCLILAVSAITACYVSSFTACLFYDMMKKNEEITIRRTVKDVVTPSIISAFMLYISVKSGKVAFNSFFHYQKL